MREIKFRFFDEKTKQYAPEAYFAASLDKDGTLNVSDYVIAEQYTGYKISKTKEVCENDILKSLHFIEPNGKKHYLYHIVLWSEHRYLFYCVSMHNYKKGDRMIGTRGNGFLYVYAKNSLEVKIVGSIHNNPELLK